MSAHTTITLRDPEEKVEVVEGGSAWVAFEFGAQVVTLIGAVEGRLLSIPWWRVVSIDTTGAHPAPSATATK
jgi:hypothetical protein